MQNNQYPKSCTTATDILSNYRFDNRGNANKKKWSNKPRKREDENNSTSLSKAPNETSATSFVQGGKDKTCYSCGSIGHLSPECPDKNKSKRKIGTSRKPGNTIWKQIGLMLTKMNKKKVTIKAAKAQIAKLDPKLDGVA
jgi:hypothetical protein